MIYILLGLLVLNLYQERRIVRTESHLKAILDGLKKRRLL